MKKIKNITLRWPIIIFLFIFGMFAHEPDHYRMQTAMGLIGVMLFLSLWVKNRVHWSAGLLFALSSISAVYCSFLPVTLSPFQEWANISVNITVNGAVHPVTLKEMGIIIFDVTAAQSLCWLLASVIPIVLISKRGLSWWLEGFAWLGLSSSTLMLYRFYTGLGASGAIYNHALDASFLAVLYPIMLFSPVIKNWYDLFCDRRWHFLESGLCLAFVICPVWAILISKSSTGIATLGGELILYYLMIYKKLYNRIWILFLGSAATASAGWAMKGKDLFDPNGRQFILKTGMAMWFHVEHYLFGIGTGSFQVMGPMIQEAQGSNIVFTWGHNEYFQILFEQGILGLLLMIIMYGYMLRNSFKTPWLFVTVAGLGIISFTQMPLRLLPMCLFSAVICRLCFERTIDDNFRNEPSP